MCTVVFLRRPDHEWPLILGANRDEMRDRPWQAPARHWPDRPEVVAGLDELASGSWLGLNDHGVVAGVLNRTGSLGPAPGKRSRGELVLEALDHSDATAAVTALGELDGRAYRSFNMFIADNRDAFWLRNGGDGAGRVDVFPLPDEVSMLTASDLCDPKSPRVRFNRQRLLNAEAPRPESGQWAAWEALLSSREELPGSGPESAMAIETGGLFGTSSSALMALPAIARPDLKPVWTFASGLPRPGAYRPVSMARLPPAAPIVSARRA